MKLNLILTAAEAARYIEARNRLIVSPELVIGEFSTQWLRIVGAIDICIWLLAATNSLETGDRDAAGLNRSEDYKLKLANTGAGPWKYEFFGTGYWVLDRELADLVLVTGIKHRGIGFIYNFDLEKIDYIFQKLLIGKIEHLW